MVAQALNVTKIFTGSGAKAVKRQATLITRYKVAELTRDPQNGSLHVSLSSKPSQPVIPSRIAVSDLSNVRGAQKLIRERSGDLEIVDLWPTDRQQGKPIRVLLPSNLPDNEILQQVLGHPMPPLPIGRGPNVMDGNKDRKHIGPSASVYSTPQQHQLPDIGFFQKNGHYVTQMKNHNLDATAERSRLGFFTSNPVRAGQVFSTRPRAEEELWRKALRVRLRMIRVTSFFVTIHWKVRNVLSASVFRCRRVVTPTVLKFYEQAFSVPHEPPVKCHIGSEESSFESANCNVARLIIYRCR